MKKINYLYFICMTLMWLGVDRLLSMLTPHHPAWRLLLPAYGCWYLLSAPFFYFIRKRKGIKKGFITFYCMEAQWTTLWIDITNKELAYLCLFNPFRIHYLPLHIIDNARVEVHYSKDIEYIDFVNCSFYINDKKTKFRVDTSGRGYLIKTETNGQAIMDRTQKFADLLNGAYHE